MASRVALVLSLSFAVLALAEAFPPPGFFQGFQPQQGQFQFPPRRPQGPPTGGLSSLPGGFQQGGFPLSFPQGGFPQGNFPQISQLFQPPPPPPPPSGSPPPPPPSGGPPPPPPLPADVSQQLLDSLTALLASDDFSGLTDDQINTILGLVQSILG